MDDLLQLIFVPGDLIQTICRICILFLSIDLVLAFACLIGESKSC